MIIGGDQIEHKGPADNRLCTYKKNSLFKRGRIKVQKAYIR